MKFIYGFITLLFLVGCGDTKEATQAPIATPEKKQEVKKVEAPKAKEPVEEVKEAKAPAPVATIDATIRKCASCHGANGEKSALNKSKIMSNLTSTEIYDSLKGYEDGSYGGEMKTLMKAQIRGLSDADFKELANHFGKN